MKPRLLIVELHHLGDAVMSLPFVRGAQGKFETHILCRPSVAPVYRMLPDPPSIHEWDPPWGDDRPCSAVDAIRAARKAGRDLKPFDFDAAACVWADARVEILIATSGAKQRIGFPMTHGNYYAAELPWRAKKLLAGRLLEMAWSLGAARRLLTTRLHRENPRQHHMRCWEQIAETLGITNDYSVPWVSAAPSSELRATGEKKLLAIHAHARLPSKQWPQHKWRELCALPAMRDAFDVLEIVPPGRGACIGDIPFVKTSDLPGLASALASVDALICHDSFPAHLAAALGKPVVAIFGSGEPDWFAPWNNRARVVQRRVCPLHPCIDRCGMDSYLCLDAITVDDVAAEAMKLAAAL